MERKRSTNFRRNWAAIFCGAVGSQTMYILMYNYSMVFFTDFLGIGAGIAGTIFVLSRVWDAVNDPMCGAIIDKSNSRFGKTQPFMLGGGIVTAMALIALFTVPNMSAAGRTVWGAVSYNMVGMAFTAVTVSTLVQMPRASSDPKERISFSVSYSIACAITGILVAMGVTRALAAFGNSDPAKGYQIVAVISAVVGLAFLLGNVFLFRDQETEEKGKEEKPKVLQMVGAILHTPPFLILVVALIIACVGIGINGGSLVYYTSHVLKNPGIMQLMLPLMYVSTFASSLTANLLSRFGKVTMMKVSMFLMALGMLGRILTGDSYMAVTLACFLITNMGAGYMSTFLIPLLMDCADYTEYITGVKCEALTLSGFTLCSKMAAGIGTAILGFALQAGGYDGMAAVQTEGAVHMIRFVHLYPMLILSLIGAGLLYFFKLDEKVMAKVRAAKEEKSNEVSNL